MTLLLDKSKDLNQSCCLEGSRGTKFDSFYNLLKLYKILIGKNHVLKSGKV